MSRGRGIRELSIAEHLKKSRQQDTVLETKCCIKTAPESSTGPHSSTHVRGQGEHHLYEQTLPQAQGLLYFTSSKVNQNGKEKLAIHGVRLRPQEDPAPEVDRASPELRLL